MAVLLRYEKLIRFLVSRQSQLVAGSWLATESLRVREQAEWIYLRSLPRDVLIARQAQLTASGKSNRKLNYLILSTFDEKRSTH